jgi:hypothetical protein
MVTGWTEQKRFYIDDVTISTEYITETIETSSSTASGTANRR